MDNSIEAKKPSPPPGWCSAGQQHAGHCDRKDVAVKLTLFGSDGTPLRATCTVSMEEAVPDSFSQNPTLGSPNSMRSHLLIEGDSLPSVAYKEYGTRRGGDPWRKPTGSMTRSTGHW